MERLEMLQKPKGLMLGAGAHVMAPCLLRAPTATLATSAFPKDVSSSPMVACSWLPTAGILCC